MIRAWLCLAVTSACCALTHGQGCWFQGQFFYYGQFSPEPCLSCFCFDTGTIDCFNIVCPTCLFYYHRPGECCASCEPPPPARPAVPPSQYRRDTDPGEIHET